MSAGSGSASTSTETVAAKRGRGGPRPRGAANRDEEPSAITTAAERSTPPPWTATSQSPSERRSIRSALQP